MQSKKRGRKKPNIIFICGQTFRIRESESSAYGVLNLIILTRPKGFLRALKNLMSKKLCRWGILGSAGIAQKNWQSIRNAENAELVAVASRDVAKSQDFIDRCSAQIPHAVMP